jgi:F-type H+-transporting ATPase subunit delta
LLEGVRPMALNLAYLLISRNRVGLASDIAEEYGRLVDAHRGIKHVLVTTAIQLDTAEQDKLKQSLARYVKGQVILESQVDPTIVGGLVARIDDKLLDGSVSSRLALLKRSLSEATSGAAK